MGGPTSPLGGRRVLDLSQAIAGPYIGRILADLGADVVRVEWPNGDVTNRFGPPTAGLTGLFHHMNAGKRGIGVDLKSPAAVDLLRRLARLADVVIENFRPGVLDRAGLGYADLAAANPALVMVSVSGFGRTGPEAGRAAYAPVIHAEAGILSRQAAFDERPIVDMTVSFADEIAALHATIAVLAALNMRAATGVGQHIDVSMLEALVATDDHVSDAIDGVAEPADSRGYVWEATGGPIMLAIQPRALWRLLSTRAGLRDTVGPDATLQEKIDSRAELIDRWLRSFDDRAGVQAALDRAGIAWADVRDASTVLESPSLRHGGVVADVDDHAGGRRGVIRMPYRFSGADSGVRGPGPRRGQHNREVLADWLGAGDAEIDALIAAGTLQGG
jgi:CoA:oxalate CoA-transferase